MRAGMILSCERAEQVSYEIRERTGGALNGSRGTKDGTACTG